MQILLVEDDITIVETLTDFLKKEDFMVCAVDGQKEALRLIEERDFDLVLLDITLKDGNGYAVCRGIKELKDIPVIFLTASSDEFSVVTGLDIGADDFIGKPFRPRELVSRIKSVLRRCGKAQTVIRAGSLCVDTAKGVVKKDGEELYLTALEYRLLLLFLSRPEQIFTRNSLLAEMWDMAGEFVNDNTLTVYIKRLREKIEEDPQNPKRIRTVRGVGYAWNGKEQKG